MTSRSKSVKYVHLSISQKDSQNLKNNHNLNFVVDVPWVLLVGPMSISLIYVIEQLTLTDCDAFAWAIVTSEMKMHERQSRLS